MCDGRRPAFDGDRGEPRCLQSALGADAQRVGVTPQHVTRDQVADDGIEEVLPGIDQHVLDGAERVGALLERCLAAASMPPVSTVAVTTSRP